MSRGAGSTPGCAPAERPRAAGSRLARGSRSFLASDRTYGARRVWHDLLADGMACGLHRIERLMRRRLRARKTAAFAAGSRRPTPTAAADRPRTVLDRQFEADRPNRKWVADFTYIWTAEGWLYVAASSTFSRGGSSAGR